jgi:site-specific DNA-methyltransferase (adenine-specific)
MNVTDKITITNEDNMQLMARYPDNYFELAIVDPPYGIGYDGSRKSTSKHGGRKEYKFKGWDNEIPKKEYFTELFRVSKNQIIWGSNYFTKFLPSSMGWLFWDKGQRINNSDGELAYTSFQQALRVVEYNRCEIQKFGGAIHPTQKPVALYKWLLDKYAKQGYKILDTHLGSGSIAIACHDYGFELTACELDAEYYEKAIQRIKNYTNQTNLFL